MRACISTELLAVPTATKRHARIKAKPTAKLVFDELQSVLGGKNKKFITPLGARLLIDCQLSDHISGKRRKEDDIRARASMFSFLPELIENPQEIWRTEEQRKDGKNVYRMLFIKNVELAGKEHILLLVVTPRKHELRTITFFPIKSTSGVAGKRKGTLLYLNHYALPVKTSRT